MSPKTIGAIVVLLAIIIIKIAVQLQFHTVGILVAIVAIIVGGHLLFGTKKSDGTRRSGQTGVGDRLAQSRAYLSQFTDSVDALMLPSIRVKTEPAGDRELELGESRLGGQPDLPKGTEWPTRDGRPLAFIAQIHLPDIAEHDTANLLPHTGDLHFFYDVMDQRWGFDPADKGGWKVLYSKADAPLTRIPTPQPLADEGQFAVCTMEFSPEITAPGLESLYIKDLGLSKEQISEYGDVEPDYEESEPSVPINRMLGHPQPVQGEMQLECQLVTHGLYCGDATGYKDPRRQELEKGATDWILLLQVDSDDNAGMMWGDLGRLYYWIPRDALTAHDFDKVWLILQCG